MSNPTRGEVTYEFGDKRYTFKFSNAGRREMETFLQMERSEIDERINQGRMGERIITGLLYGATRKFHARELPSVAPHVDNLVDDIVEADEDAESAENQTELMACLMAAYTRTDVEQFRKLLKNEVEEAQPGGAEEAAPKAKTKGKTKTQSGSSSETGTVSLEKAS